MFAIYLPNYVKTAKNTLDQAKSKTVYPFGSYSYDATADVAVWYHCHRNYKGIPCLNRTLGSGSILSRFNYRLKEHTPGH